MSAILAEYASPPAAWRRPAIMLGTVLLVVLLLYRETAVTMVGIWARSDTFAHAFLVPPISFWLAWRGRDRLQVLKPQPDLLWLVPLGLAAVLWLAGKLVAVNAVMQFALMAMLVLSVPLVLGRAVGRALLFPLLFLFFCVPVGEFMLPVLMEGTADFTVAALRLSGIPVFREGLQFVIPSGNWSVVEACSGVRYLIASVMVGSLFAYLNYQSLTRRLVFVGVSIVVPVIANWLRAYMIVMLGHLSDNRIATGVDHLIYGWVFFGIVITIMFMIGARWSEPDRALTEPTPAGIAVMGGRAFNGATGFALIGALLVLAVPQVAVTLMNRQIATAPVQLSWPVGGQGGWKLEASAASWTPRFEGASDTRTASFSREGQAVGVFAAYYRAQGQDRKLVSSVNMLVPANDPTWNAVSTSLYRMSIDGAEVQWRSTHLLGRSAGLSSGRRQLTVWQAYWIDDVLTSSDIGAKFQSMRVLLAGRGDDGAALVLHTEVGPQDGGDRILAAFVESNLPALRQALRQARSTR